MEGFDFLQERIDALENDALETRLQALEARFADVEDAHEAICVRMHSLETSELSLEESEEEAP